jgi:hypothetical protein
LAAIAGSNYRRASFADKRAVARRAEKCSDQAIVAKPAALDFAPRFALVCFYTGKEVDPAYEQRFFGM